MKILKTKIPARSVATVSLIGIMGKEFPISYGNYFSMYIDESKLPDDMKTHETINCVRWYNVCNFNHENYEEAYQRFLTDNMVEITLFKPDNSNRLVVAITDERIPEDWYHMWAEKQGYCNGGINGEVYQDVVKTLGKRFTGIKEKINE